jgi:hypothetical protein
MLVIWIVAMTVLFSRLFGHRTQNRVKGGGAGLASAR